MVLLAGDYECVGPGWKPILKALDQSITNVLDNSKTRCECKILQIKEKFGGLRFYFELKGLDEERRAKIWGAVMMAECMSYKTCEVCGATTDVSTEPSRKPRGEGRMGGGRTLTLCDKCHKKRAEEGGLEFGKFEV